MMKSGCGSGDKSDLWSPPTSTSSIGLIIIRMIFHSTDTRIPFRSRYWLSLGEPFLVHSLRNAGSLPPPSLPPPLLGQSPFGGFWSWCIRNDLDHCGMITQTFHLKTPIFSTSLAAVSPICRYKPELKYCRTRNTFLPSLFLFMRTRNNLHRLRIFLFFWKYTNVQSSFWRHCKSGMWCGSCTPYDSMPCIILQLLSNICDQILSYSILDVNPFLVFLFFPVCGIISNLIWGRKGCGWLGQVINCLSHTILWEESLSNTAHWTQSEHLKVSHTFEPSSASSSSQRARRL